MDEHRFDGRVALTAGEDNTVRLWEVADGSARGNPFDHPGTVRAAAFSPDGQIVVTEGLKAGERIVVDGQLRLAPGVKVKAETPSGAGEPGDETER